MSNSQHKFRHLIKNMTNTILCIISLSLNYFFNQMINVTVRPTLSRVKLEDVPYTCRALILNIYRWATDRVPLLQIRFLQVRASKDPKSLQSSHGEKGEKEEKIQLLLFLLIL